MELIVCGAGPAYSSRSGAVGSAYLVREGEAAILLDLGQGTFSNLARAIEPSSLLLIAISHLHPDHFIDLVPLRHYLRFEFEPPRRMRVLAPRGLVARLDALHDQPGFAAEALDVVDLADGDIRRVGPFTFTAGRVRHSGDSHGFRVATDRGAGLVYSGDLERGEDLGPLIRPGDTLLCEASFGTGPVAPGAGHLDAEAAGRLAASSCAARLLLTHLLSGRDRDETLRVARETAGVETALVDPGDRYRI